MVAAVHLSLPSHRSSPGIHRLTALLDGKCVSRYLSGWVAR